jgi:hypothetical protein
MKISDKCWTIAKHEANQDPLKIRPKCVPI